MQVQSYLFFDGRCEEALDFYQAALGAEITALMRYKDAPPQPESSAQEGCGPGQMAPEKSCTPICRLGRPKSWRLTA